MYREEGLFDPVIDFLSQLTQRAQMFLFLTLLGFIFAPAMGFGMLLGAVFCEWVHDAKDDAEWFVQEEEEKDLTEDLK